MNLISKGIIGSSWTALSSFLNLSLRLVQIYILTKILSPAEFGTIALTMSVVGFSELFRDFGISNAIIHKKDISKNQLSSLFIFNFFLGILFFVLLNFSASYLANFFNNLSLESTIKAISYTFIFNAIGSQFNSLLKKNLEFRTVAYIEIISLIISFSLSIYLAFNNYGLFSLIFSSLAASFISNILFVLKGISFHKPRIFFDIYEIIFFIKFGLFQMSHNAISLLNKDVDYFIIGKILGSEILGIYSLIKELAFKPAFFLNPIIMKVGFPMLSKVQDDKNLLGSMYLKIIKCISIINIPVYFIMAMIPVNIISFLFGKSWNDSYDIFIVLCFAFLIRSLNSPAGALLLSKGMADKGFYWSIFEIIMSVTILSISVNFGLYCVALSVLTLQIFMFIVHSKYIVSSIIGTNPLNIVKSFIKTLILVILLRILFFQLFGSEFSNKEAVLVVCLFLFAYLSFIYFVEKTIIRKILDSIKRER